MGVPRLKKKGELNYRVGRPRCWCSDCQSFVSHFLVRGVDGAALRVEDRCKVIGLKNSRRYKISAMYCCDAFKLPDIRKCRICGCTDDNCRQCIERTGEPCHWVDEDLCSACAKRGKI